MCANNDFKLEHYSACRAFKESDINSLQPTVKDWLKTLEMEEYTEVFHRAGYKTEEDIENLKEIDDKELRRMGIVKMGTQHYPFSYMIELLVCDFLCHTAHVQRLKRALESLFHPTAGRDQKENCVYLCVPDIVSFLQLTFRFMRPRETSAPTAQPQLTATTGKHSSGRLSSATNSNQSPFASSKRVRKLVRS